MASELQGWVLRPVTEGFARGDTWGTLLKAPVSHSAPAELCELLSQGESQLHGVSPISTCLWELGLSRTSSLQHSKFPCAIPCLCLPEPPLQGSLWSSAPGQAHRAAPPSPVRDLRDPVLGKGQPKKDSTLQCSCQGLLACAEEQNLDPGPTVKPGHESTCKGSDSHITRKLIFLPSSANKMVFPDSSQSLFLPSQIIAACCVSKVGPCGHGALC